MLITYLVTVYNKEKYVANVIDSLKSIKGNFRREFIIIDDGSTDKSLEIIKTHLAPLTKVTIISQQNQGPAIAINKGLRLANGNYIHFVDGDDIIAENATEILLKACADFDTEVAYGLRGQFNHDENTGFSSKREKEGVVLIDNPLKSILKGEFTGVRSIGSSGSLINRSLLEKTGGADSGVFVQDLSISLRCAKHSKFAFVQKTVSYSPSLFSEARLSYNRKFEGYNSLKAILGFIENNEEIAAKLSHELNYTLRSTLWKLNKFRFSDFWNYIMVKCSGQNLPYSELIALYKKYINTLL